MGRKLLFFDIDGTLWDFHNHIPQSAIDGIRAARANGHLAFINSGRSRAFIFDPALLAIGFDGIVSGCGTMVEYHDELPFYYRMDPEFIEETIHTVRRYQFRPLLEGRYNLYLDDQEFDGEPYGEKLRKELGERLLSINAYWGRWEASKLSCATLPKGQGHAECIAALSDQFEFMVHNSEVVEMSPKGYTKGTAIQRVCEILDADIADTVAFGDSPNDLAMLEAAGTAVVMGNGTDSAKALADYVTRDIHDDGIAHALRHLELI